MRGRVWRMPWIARGRRDGFTLIELLICMVIIGILVTVVVFAVAGITGTRGEFSPEQQVRDCVARGGEPYYTQTRDGRVWKYLGCGE